MITKKAKDLKAGDRFRSKNKTEFLTCTENKGPHLLYGHIICTEERGNLTMPEDLDLVIEQTEEGAN